MTQPAPAPEQPPALPAGRRGLPVGVHRDVPFATYRQDPCFPEPSLSSGVLRRLLSSSPEHARLIHPRLNPDWTASQSTEAQQRGSILHALMLEQDTGVVMLDVADFRTKAAQEARDRALSDGLIPMTRTAANELIEIAHRIRARLTAEFPEVHEAMREAIRLRDTEVTLVWRQSGTLCRARVDILPPPRFGAIYDLKFTGLTAAPEAFGKVLLRDHAIQAEFYPDGVEALTKTRPDMVFIACETAPPYGVTLHALSPQAAELTREQITVGLALWRRCLKRKHWPSYPTRVHYHDAPGWAARLWDDEQQVLQQMMEMTTERAPA